MKKIIIFITFLFFTIYSFSQKNIEKKYYYFYIKISIEEKTSQYKINDVSNEIDSCKLNQFVDIQAKLNEKGIVAIGPFTSKISTINSKEIYEKASHDLVKNRKNYIENKNNVYWYFVTLNEKNDSKQYQFERMPARIANGNILQFDSALINNITFKNLCIGYFDEYEAAEESKRLNRQLENIDNFERKFANRKNLNFMKKNIDKIKFVTNDSCVQINIPPKYFKKNVCMLISSFVVCKDSTFEIENVTFQGENVKNNNVYVFSYAKGGSWKLNLDKKQNPSKIIFKIILQNDKYKIECKNIELDLKQ